MAMVKMAAAVSDSTAENTKAVDSAGAAEQTTEASEAPTANSICGARHRRAGQVQSGTFGETCGRLAWQPSRSQAGQGVGPPARSPRCGQVGDGWLREASLPRRALTSLMMSTSPCL